MQWQGSEVQGGGWTIREFEEEDLDAVLRVFQDAVRKVAARDYIPEQVEAWAPDPPDQPSWCRRLARCAVFVYVVQGQVVGFIAMEANGHVDMLFVDPGHLRRGIGTALLDHARAWALERGVRRLTTDASITARPFFEHAGFRLVEHRIVPLRGMMFRNFHMSLDCRPGPGSDTG
ncbi:GNAT family N-acetyltransferase [Thioalkalivibrio sulfidiphilus]|uniref:GCN5-related N-acetyltransferase n=1 Tax=Thioalkalivibrio sulfidiphilus (strain HL-EbGR7) TaxID=396588 RepID=B8GNV9_THISH|nr:GNAT family N-acetyltransferase [Thioalkalivibrio sulfidiphilus]ACL72048.1 GCN5-related N-acetyltransferase [Thioalkalivibrio sulfidiphilus HL-EbGr7]